MPRVTVTVVGAEKLGELGKRLKAVDKEKKIPRRLNKAIRDTTKPAVVDVQRVIRTLPVKGSRGGGRKQRAAHAFDKSFGQAAKKDETSKEELAGIEDRHRQRAKERSGLRDSIARAIKTEIKTGPRAPAVRIVVDEKQLPPDQRSLPRHLDSERGWKHPTFGRSPWTWQKGQPWFGVTIRKHAPAMRKRILRVMDEIAKEIEKET